MGQTDSSLKQETQVLEQKIQIGEIQGQTNVMKESEARQANQTTNQPQDQTERG